MSLPTARPIGDAPSLGWGILGTGWIAGKFTAALRARTGQRIVAVGSRDRDKAQRFAAEVGAARAHGSYGALVADPGVDIVYVATPHAHHVPDALLAIAAGKHVLVEKPLGISVADAERLVRAAGEAGVFCGEALWSLYLPKFDVIGQLLDAGELGEITGLQADIGEWFDPGHRIFDPALAGGCMLDLATYPVMFAHRVSGAPVEVRAVGGRRGGTGVMSTTSMSLRTAAGVESVLQASAEAALPTRAAVGGSAALLDLPGPFYQPGGFALTRRGGHREQYEEPAIGHAGLFWQALHVAAAIGEGRSQTVQRPLADSLATLAIMDEVRRLTGDRFLAEG